MGLTIYPAIRFWFFTKRNQGRGGKWTILDLRQEKDKWSLEYLLVSENKVHPESSGTSQGEWDASLQWLPLGNVGKFEYKELHEKNVYTWLYIIEYVFHLFSDNSDEKEIIKDKTHFVTIDSVYYTNSLLKKKRSIYSAYLREILIDP